MSDLEDDFDKTIEQINLKLQEAAKALKEAANLSEKINLPGLFYTQFIKDDMARTNRYADKPLDKYEFEDAVADIKDKLDQIDVEDIESAIQACGWQTSSSYC